MEWRWERPYLVNGEWLSHCSKSIWWLFLQQPCRKPLLLDFISPISLTLLLPQEKSMSEKYMIVLDLGSFSNNIYTRTHKTMQEKCLQVYTYTIPQFKQAFPDLLLKNFTLHFREMYIFSLILQSFFSLHQPNSSNSLLFFIIKDKSCIKFFRQFKSEYLLYYRSLSSIAQNIYFLLILCCS